MDRFIKQAKQFIMESAAKQQLSVGSSLFPRALIAEVSKLPPPVQDALPAAMEELKHEGFFDENDCMTVKAYNSIHGVPSERVENAKRSILDDLRNQNARVGYTYNWRAFMAAPAALREALPEAVKQLQSEGILDENEALTELGYRNLY